MSYFPILSAPFCEGRTTIYNFSPNNWENLSKHTKFVNLTWSSHGLWHSISFDELPYGTAKSYTTFDLPNSDLGNSLPLLSLTPCKLPAHSTVLPSVPSPNRFPTWRASLELFTNSASTSYQGELDPFPVKASLLSFSPLLQINTSITNFLLFLNIESSPVPRTSSLEIYRTLDICNRLDNHQVFNNSITCIGLDTLNLKQNDLPLFLSRNMSGVPLFLSISEDLTAMSLEHTHPPASYVVHGKRWASQKYLKSRWGINPEIK